MTVRVANRTIGCFNIFFSFSAGGGWSSSTCSASFVNPTTLAQTGTYTIRLDPNGANAGTADISVTSH